MALNNDPSYIYPHGVVKHINTNIGTLRGIMISLMGHPQNSIPSHPVTRDGSINSPHLCLLWTTRLRYLAMVVYMNTSISSNDFV